ncbi:hypothetical protein CAPTEDRAFT_192643 [Capitella teleta]|uniref:Protein kinase domain-containing protein n=1 Tax=Capitella teleta TaxID=283909 RepID=R7UI70_CAPTE|nr:hypothetical protein CAPTEDRAFT_192643 [Capitella teleta]|eukprot:ELU03478.1 hypothetical protein CAPTEDRAFT_192643 [Capitella teleta]
MSVLKIPICNSNHNSIANRFYGASSHRSWEKYKILGKKGEGTFSEVLKCQDLKRGALWADKKLKQHYKSLEQVNNLREIQAMRRLGPHPNILELQEVLFDKKSGTLVLICELMDMNIYELIRGRKHYLGENKVKTLMYQLCRSIDHMHRNGIFHRDVKPENILIRDEVLKLADFGSCRSIHSKQPYTEYISTRWYRAPECLLTDGYYSYKMDVWSVGCVFFEILTKTKGMNFNFPVKKGTGLEKLMPQASQECIELIYQMCAYDPEERITAKVALKHPYFKEFREAERRAAAIAKQQKVQQQRDVIKKEDEEMAKERKKEKQEKEKRDIDKSDVDQTEKASAIEENKENADNVSVIAERISKPEKVKRLEMGQEKDLLPPNKKKSIRPGSHTSPQHAASSYHASTLINRGPMYQYHRKEKRKRKYQRRTVEPNTSPESSSSFFPKVIHPKPGSFQVPFRSSFNLSTGNSSVSKVGGASNPTFFPSLSQAFVKPAAKSKPTNEATKNIHGRYQLPSIDRRGGGDY